MSNRWILTALFIATASRSIAATCESLASLALPETTITSAQPVAAGAFTMPGGGFMPSPISPKSLPAFCRVAATLRPSKDSDIKIEVWLPVKGGWNGKFQGVGNGGWTGSITYPALMEALQKGYASASTDTGHAGNPLDGSFALGHPEKVIDFGYRAVHEMTVKAKAIVAAYYDKSAQYSYWNGCSSGGKQGLKEAQRYPNDYDGIIAGAPANYWTHLTAATVWVGAATHKDEASFIPTDKYRVIHDAAAISIQKPWSVPAPTRPLA
jgi:feruloyl esterase